MDAKRNLHDGGQGKSKLIEVIKASDDYRSSIRCPDNVQCVVFDGFCMLRHIDIKQHIKTGLDLAKVVSDWIAYRTSGCRTVIVAFDTYNESSLKSKTRSNRYKKHQQCKITQSTNVADKTWKQLLAHDKTKSSLVDLFMGQIVTDLNLRHVNFVVAGSNRTYTRDKERYNVILKFGPFIRLKMQTGNFRNDIVGSNFHYGSRH